MKTKKLDVLSLFLGIYGIGIMSLGYWVIYSHVNFHSFEGFLALFVGGGVVAIGLIVLSHVKPLLGGKDDS